MIVHFPQVELDALLPKRLQAQQLEGEVSHCTPRGVTLPQLCDLAARKLAVQEPDEVVRRAFRAFDSGAKGYVSRGDLEDVVARVAPQLPRNTVDLIFSQVDTDRDSKVSFRDFHAMMIARPDGRSTGLGDSVARMRPVSTAW